jgi:hypothetical protein
MKTTQPCSERKRPAFPRRTQTAFRVLLSVLLGMPLLAASAQEQEVLIKELGKAPGDPRPPGRFPQYDHLLVSPSGERVAYVMRQANRAVLFCDGKEGPVWDDITRVGITTKSPFSRDGRRLPYQASRDEQAFLVFAGEEAKALSTPGAGNAVYPPDGTRYAYPVGGVSFVCDGKEGPRYQEVGHSTYLFSPDGKRFAYSATDETGKTFVVLDGQPLKGYEEIATLTFSPDGKRLAYIAGLGGNEMLVCDGKEGKSFPKVFSPIFSPDSQSLAYWAWSVKPVFPDPAPNLVMFVIRDEKEVAQMRGEPRLAFSPDSRILGCGTHSGEMYRFGDKSERLTTGYESASAPVFSPDGQHIAYAAGKGMKWRLCVNGKSLSGTFDPEDGEFWSGFDSGGFRMILDPPGFSADGQHVLAKGFRGPLASRARGDRKHFIVCDGIEGPSHDGLWIPEDFRNHAKRLRYVVQDGERLRLMELAWPKNRTWQDAIE